METKSTLKLQRIFITLFFFFSIPLVSKFIDTYVNNLPISYSLAISTMGLFNIIYNWNLFALHYNRAKKNMGDTIFYSIFGFIILYFIFFILFKYNINFYILNKLVLTSNNSLAKILVLICFSYLHIFNTLIAYKCMVDRLKFVLSPLWIIILSGLLFSFFYTLFYYTLFYVPFNLSMTLTSFLIYSIVFIFCSYLYNQARSLVPAMVALSMVLAIINLPIIF